MKINLLCEDLNKEFYLVVVVLIE